MKKRNKVFLLALTLTNTIIMPIPSVYAWSGGSFADTSDGTTATPNEPITVPEYVIGKSGDTEYTCSYKYNTSVKTSITINGYNNGESIMENSLIVSEEERNIAGTPIGFSIKEEKTIGYQVVEFTAKEYKVTTNEKVTCQCFYKSTSKPPILFNSLNFLAVNPAKCFPKTINSYNCPQKNGENCEYLTKKCTTSKTENKSSSQLDRGEYYEKCKQAAINKAKTEAEKRKGSSFKLSLPNSNYTEEELKGKPINANTTSYTVTGSGSNCKLQGNLWKESATCKYYYSLKKACLNKKTALVTYKDECNSDEIESVPTKSGTWNYFTPLSSKSDKSVEISLMPAGSPITVNECLYVITHNNSTNPKDTNYTSLIRPIDLSQKFNGDALGCTTEECIKAKSDYKKIEGKGCYLTINIKLPLKQKFYNEETENGQIKFKGFNFYYRQIDYKNPFPNGLDENSYWYDWYQTNYQNGTYTKNIESPNIMSSFNTRTYEATNINATEVRKYTSSNPYTSWNGMFSSGQSGFIKQGYVKRITNQNYYSLGCGPANNTWKGCGN